MASYSNTEGSALLKSGDYSDFTITCGGQVFKVHKNVVGVKSEFFRVCINGNFKESTAATVDFPEQEPHILAAALMFMYTGSCETELITDVWPALQFQFAQITKDAARFYTNGIKVAKCADFLSLQKLKEHVMLDMFSYPASNRGVCDQDNPWCTCNSGSRCAQHDVEMAALHYDLLEAVYQHAPEDEDFCARAIVAALESVRATKGVYVQRKPAPAPAAADPWGHTVDWNSEREDRSAFVATETSEEVLEKAANLQERLSRMLKDHDPVAWNVALHYRNAIEDLVNDHKRELEDVHASLKRSTVYTTYGSRGLPWGRQATYPRYEGLEPDHTGSKTAWDSLPHHPRTRW